MDIETLKYVINGGPALLLLIGLVFVWRAWRCDLKKNEEQAVEARKGLKEIQDQRVVDAQAWSQKYNDLAGQVQTSLNTMEGFMRVVERTLSGGDAHGG